METGATFLRWLRRPGDERQLTDCLGYAAKVDDGFAKGLAESLLRSVRESAHERGAELAESLLASMPEALTCQPEDPATGAVPNAGDCSAESDHHKKAESTGS
jgi:hypothetical protein